MLATRFWMRLALGAALAAAAGAAEKPRRRPRRPAVALPGKKILEANFDRGLEGWRGRGDIVWAPRAGQPWAGKGCVKGAVDRPRRANFLEHELTLKANCIYRFTCWARADRPRAKLVLFLAQGKTRPRVGDWRNVNRRWRAFAIQFAPPRPGRWTLQIVLPSSFGAAPCAMWIDRVQVFETALPRSTAITNGEGYGGEPSLAADREGALWLSWLAYQDGRDALRVARLDAEGETARIAQSWSVAAPPRNTGVLGSRLVPADAGAWLVFACEVDRNWDIYAARVTAQGPSKPRRVTTSPAVDAWPAGAVWNGRLWLAWESNRDGRRQVYAAPAEGGEPMRLSDPGANSYSPDLAAYDGELCVAWHAFAGGAYDIFGRRIRAGRLGPIEQLSFSRDPDRHPRLAASSSGLWIVWQRSLYAGRLKAGETRTYRPGIVADRQSLLCRWTRAGAQLAEGWREALLPRGTEAPSLAVDSAGRVWVTARRARSRIGWDSVLQCFAGRAWGRAWQISAKLGWDEAAGLAVARGRVWVAYQVGYTPAFRDVNASLAARSDIRLASVPLRGAPAFQQPKTTPLPRPTQPAALDLLRKELGEDSPPRSLTYRGRTYHLYFGDFHEHSSISQCVRWRDINPNDSYGYERDIIHADFSALTDHGYNFCPALWARLSKIVRVNHDPGRFVAFLAEEWTSSFEKYSKKYPAGYYGHHNLVFADPYLPRWWNARDGQTPAEVWTDLRKMKTDFVVIPHQLADTGNVPVAWEFHDEAAQPVAEIFQARQSYEYKGCPRQARRTIDNHFIQDAWARGIVIGVIASPDHGGGQGKACVYAEKKTREAILDALRARRCYGTSAARIFLDVRVNGALMGEKIAARRGQPVVVTARVIAPNDIARVDLCRSNEFIYSKPVQGRVAEFTYRDVAPKDGVSYYYARVQQKDGELAWSSPVWVTIR